MIHPTALIDPAAQLDPTVTIGAYAIIEGPVKLAAGVTVGAHAQILGDTSIGASTSIGRAAIIGGDPQDLSFDPATPSQVIIGQNNTIREQVTIHRGSKNGSATRLGDHNFIMANAHFAHDTQIGNRNVVANAALLAGHVHVGNNTFIGGGSVFHQFIRVGDHAFIGGGAGVMHDVIPFGLVRDNPAHLAGLNLVGLRRRGFTREQIHVGERAVIDWIMQTAPAYLFTTAAPPMIAAASLKAIDLMQAGDVLRLLDRVVVAVEGFVLDGQAGRRWAGGWSTHLRR